MKRQILAAVVVLGLLACAGSALLHSSFISFKGKPIAANAAAQAVDASLPTKITFNEDIQPVLSENCYFCHGQDTTARKADLRVDREEFAFLPRKNGPPVIVKGHPEQSALIARISSTDPNMVMPPPSSHKQPLTARQIALLTRWVKEGAKYEEHWAFVAPVRPALPQVSQPDWVKTPIDAFVLAKLDSKGLAPEPEADRRSLIRRVTFDLTGLPPTPEEVSAFLADTSSNAYEKVVDRLLASSHYGEHEARYWLDAARYAETVGLHFDEPQSIYPYRDWVIRAFNDNKRFDQFVTEQVAGDLLPHATIDQQVATGFTRCGISTREGGSIEEEVLASYAKEHVETNATTFLGLTMGCCACHDHKFDPISQKEFYEFSAFFRNTTQKALDPATEPSIPPYIHVPSAADAPRWQALPAEREAAQAALDHYAAAFDAGSKPQFPGMIAALAKTAAPALSATNLELELPLTEGTGQQIKSATNGAYTLSGTSKWTAEGLFGPALQLEGSTAAELGNIGDFDTKDHFSFGCWLRVTGAGQGAVLAKMDTNDSAYRGWDLWLENGRVGVHLDNNYPQNSLYEETLRALPQNTWQHVFVTYDGSGKASGLKIYINGVLEQKPRVLSKSLTGSIRTPVPLTFASRTSGANARGVAIEDVRIYRATLSPADIAVLNGDATMRVVIQTPVDKLSATQRGFLQKYYLQQADPQYAALQKKVETLKEEYDTIAARSPTTMVMDEKPTPPFAFLLKRGQYDQRGEKLSPGVPKVLPPMPPGVPDNRLGLAKWLVEPQNPLLSRVTVNRFWQQLFGIGIVRTAEDFGVMGDRPVNQPLLDWMAVEFRESHWDVKHMFKLMVMSSAYRQSDHISQAKLDADPENRLISRGPRFRLDAEEIRDQALAVSGLLNPEIGGPSVKPYQPPGLWEAVSMTGEVYHKDSGPALYRRSMYTYLKRLAPQPELTTFDATSREVCTVRRERTDTPLQALAMENDTQYVEAARHLAVNAIESTPDPAKRLDYMSERLLARPLSAEEQEILLRSLQQFHQTYTKKADAAAKLIQVGDSAPNTTIPVPEQAAWTMIASEFLNLDETLNK